MRRARLRVMQKTLWVEIGAAFLIGLALRFVVNLEPVWWLAWFVPGLLFALSLRTGNWRARGLVALSAIVGVTVNAPFFAKVMPLPAVVVVMLLMTLLWVFVGWLSLSCIVSSGIDLCLLPPRQ